MKFIFRATLILLAVLSATQAAFAHHVMGGKLPATFMQGILSGLGHPIIGPDHLAFLLAVGIAAGIAGLNLAFPALFVVASACGVALHVTGVYVPGAEIIVAVSVVLAGAVIARGRGFSTWGWAATFALAGLFHGYAFGESIFGAERAPLVAYLLGLVAIQTALTVGIAFVVRRQSRKPADLMPRLAGALILGVGCAVLMSQIVPGA